jgi:hypothetical protein
MGKNNQGSRVLEVKIISIIEGFVYDKVVVLHTSRYDFVPGAKIKAKICSYDLGLSIKL